MRWADIPSEARQTVLETLRAEAQRRQTEAQRGQGVAAALGRPSLTEGPLEVAVAFAAALELLESAAHPTP